MSTHVVDKLRSHVTDFRDGGKAQNVPDVLAAEGDGGAGALPLHVQPLPALRRLPKPRLQLRLQGTNSTFSLKRA